MNINTFIRGAVACFTTAAALCFSTPAEAQRACGQQLLMERMQASYPASWSAYQANRNAMYAAAQTEPGTGAKTTAQYRIPVIFHIVVTQSQFNRLGGNTGIAQRVDSQMKVINRDFTKSNPDLGLVPAPFVPLIGNAGITFGLANTTPQNTPSVGYQIKILAPGTDSVFDVLNGSAGSGLFVSDAKYDGPKGLSAWDPNKYLNVWVVRITDGGQEGILGITTPPSYTDGNIGSLPFAERGITLTYGAFGRRRSGTDYYISGIDRGRTLTHELGHYFELRHIWGDDNNSCPGNVNYEDDGITDTPPQGDENFGCPSFPTTSCAGNPNGDMFMNFMDYVNDACMQMFTNGQVVVMKAQVQPGAPSYSLTQQPGMVLGIKDRTSDMGRMDVYPNPARSTLHVVLPKGTQSTAPYRINLYNTVGQAVYSSGDIGNTNNTIEIPVGHLPRGVYYLHCNRETGKAVQKVVLQ